MSRQAKDSARRTVRAGHTTALAVSDKTQRELEEHEHGHRAKPISLWPLDFETALEGLLAVKWPPQKKKKKKKRRPSSEHQEP